MITKLGSLALRTEVRVINHCSPVPAKKASVSCQSISTPSRLLFMTNYAKLLAIVVGSLPKLVGVYDFPKALTSNLIPLSLYSFFSRDLISESVLPNIEFVPNTEVG